MRSSIVLAILLFSSPVLAQTPCAPHALPPYDPYKPSDIAIMRDYAGTVLAQAPLSTLLKLDPYVPSQGELLRQLGRAIPVWTAYPAYTYPAIAAHSAVTTGRDCEPRPQPAEPAVVAAPPLTTLAEVLARLEPARASGVSVPAVTSPALPSDGSIRVWIQYAGRSWVTAGPAVPLTDTDFVRVGDSRGLPVFQRAGAKDDVIFVPTTSGMVAPFRAAK